MRSANAPLALMALSATNAIAASMSVSPVAASSAASSDFLPRTIEDLR
jgi:hypothetical protein